MQASILVYRLFDTADSIDLVKAESLLATGGHVSRLRLTRVSPKAIVFKDPPVTVMLAQQQIPVGDRTFPADVRARIYDFGVISIIMQVNLPDDFVYQDLINLAPAIDQMPDIFFLRTLEAVLTGIRPALKSEHASIVEEDLVVYYFKEWHQDWDPVPVLLADKEPVSPETRQETLANRLSYANDFTLLGWNTVIVYDPSGSPDIPDLLEFANAQFLELRYYDLMLNQEIDKMYDAITEAERTVVYRRLGRYRRIRRQLLELMADITSVTSEIENSLRITEDVFYARVYTTYLRILRIHDWTASIDQRVEVIQRSYNLLTDEVVTNRAEIMEVAIILLIAFEIILSLVKFH
ncbi:hypothetical protein [Sporomusa sp.]|jgi:hypothetical protein|uniref:hypothetical protein n=1 Tax=Sporomusa sp. TaxID=2078658 RepID=UPI002C4F787B|nr:hypothetical protein [Sporomusa sp.]MDF2875621.1 hypothetical protein [Sporomusa sp.]HWR08806.1 hypothetical protein [Sporomusa sp.]